MPQGPVPTPAVAAAAPKSEAIVQAIESNWNLAPKPEVAHTVITPAQAPITYAQPAPVVAPVTYAQAAPAVAPVTVPVQASPAHVIASSPYVYPNSYANAAPVLAGNYAYHAPVTPVAAPVASVSHSGVDDLQNNQHHAQDDWGQYNYGYSSPTSAKQEVKTADGIVRGSYR